MTSTFIASATWCSGNDFGSTPAERPLVVSTPWGRVGFAICADMIYRKVWSDYRDRIDLAVVSAAWPDFADRDSGRRHWLLGHVGPLSARFRRRSRWTWAFRSFSPTSVARPARRSPCCDTRIRDRFAGQSSICDGRHGEPVRAGREPSLLIAPITIHQQRGMKSWRSMSPSAPVASCSESALS